MVGGRAPKSLQGQRSSGLNRVGALVGIVGAMQAAEALKLLAGVGQTLAGRLMLYDALRGEWNTLRVARQADCPVCGSRHPHTAPM